MVSSYIEKGTLPTEAPTLTAEGMNVYGKVSAKNPGEGVFAFVEKGKQKGSYVALQAYVQRTPETDNAFESMRKSLREKSKLATTLGYGPCFLHSTGQLHKGDAGLGLFIQFTCDDLQDIPIPDQPGSPKSSVSFGVLKMAEALGDQKALFDKGRGVIRIHLGKDVGRGLNYLEAALSLKEIETSTKEGQQHLTATENKKGS